MNEIQHSGTGSTSNAFLLVCLWIMNLIMSIDPSTVVTVITGISTLLYGFNQLLTLIQKLKKRKADATTNEA